MTLFRIKSAPFVLIEDDTNKNILPLLLEIVQEDKEHINLICYEQPICLWSNVFKGHSNIRYLDGLITDSFSTGSGTVIIDSVNQMSLCLGWTGCLKLIRRLQNDLNVNRLVLILHRDCISHGSKLQTHLNHMSNVIISYNKTNCNILVTLKKGNKVIRTEEVITYDQILCILKLTLFKKEEKIEEEQVRPLPEKLSTFKIEVDRPSELVQKSNLILPYMSKIHDGQSKVYYEPDAVDDWDEEDPDEDLDI